MPNSSLPSPYREYPDQHISQQFYLPSVGSHRIFVRLLGHRDGQAMVVLHGGPGSGCNDAMAAPFDLERFLLVMIDQRGCGRSRPQGRVQQNTTAWLIRDIETVRRYLGIPRWHVYGGSWGASLALAYAGAHPEAVQRLLLRSLFLATPNEVRNLLYRSRYRRPKAWQHLSALVNTSDPTALLAAIFDQLQSPSHLAGAIANAYSNLERALLMPYKAPRLQVPSTPKTERLRDKYHIQSHYLMRDCFMPSGYLATQARRAYEHGISGVAIHGKHDPLCPPSNLTWLTQHMPSMQAQLVDAKHLAHEPAMHRALQEAARQL